MAAKEQLTAMEMIWGFMSGTTGHMGKTDFAPQKEAFGDSGRIHTGSCPAPLLPCRKLRKQGEAMLWHRNRDSGFVSFSFGSTSNTFFLRT